MAIARATRALIGAFERKRTATPRDLRTAPAAIDALRNRRVVPAVRAYRVELGRAGRKVHDLERGVVATANKTNLTADNV